MFVWFRCVYSIELRWFFFHKFAVLANLTIRYTLYCRSYDLKISLPPPISQLLDVPMD